MSTLKQGEGVSLQEQKDAILAYAQGQGLDVVEWFEEKETAAKSGRPKFNRMLKLLRRGKAAGLIMHKIDRSARNLKDWSIVSELPDQGIQVFVATESLDFTTRGGRLTADMLAVIASDFIRNLREETKKGIRGRLKQGLYPFRAPIGYVDNGKGRPKTLCPVKAPLIKEMFELYGSGQHSLRSIHAEVQRRGLLNHSGRPLSLCGVETILRNPFYTGIIEIKRTGEIFKGVHEPLITPSLYQLVQDIKTGRCGPKITRHNHLFQGLFRCGLCNAPMSPELQKGRVYYRCQRPDCATKTVREDVLDDEVYQKLKVLQVSPENATKLEKEWLSDADPTGRDDLRRSIELRISLLEQSISRAADLLIDGTLDNETYVTKRKESSLKVAQLREELQKLPDAAEIKANAKQFIELMKTLAGLYQSLKRDEKREFIKNAFSNRTVVERKLTLEPHSWLTEAKVGLGVLDGAPHRDTDRTLEATCDSKRIETLIIMKENVSPSRAESCSGS
ncbi:recombinase family protein [Sulfitobacter sp. JBTF-M27]|uniref:Recombinase family protein n=1 Tax=Sulfitobacter sediminilitoris TaxID=2698830 RepID=A0A6P0CI85_9RHOB|nr:recombinase family protein [Sulfitobacter sediminilitoris]